jgi:hypothetical protein
MPLVAVDELLTFSNPGASLFKVLVVTPEFYLEFLSAYERILASRSGIGSR